jgi:hypothetical protein
MEGVKTWASSQAADFFNIGKPKLIPDMTSGSITVVTMLRSSLSVYIFFVYNELFLTACFVNRLLKSISKQPSYKETVEVESVTDIKYF